MKCLATLTEPPPFFAAQGATPGDGGRPQLLIEVWARLLELTAAHWKSLLQGWVRWDLTKIMAKHSDQRITVSPAGLASSHSEGNF